MGCHFLLQEVFPPQGSNLCLLHCRQILCHWAIWEDPIYSTGEVKAAVSEEGSEHISPSHSPCLLLRRLRRMPPKPLRTQGRNHSSWLYRNSKFWLAGLGISVVILLASRKPGKCQHMSIKLSSKPSGRFRPSSWLCFSLLSGMLPFPTPSLTCSHLSSLSCLRFQVALLTAPSTQATETFSFLFQLEDNCFTRLCWLLLYNNMNQP